MKPLDSKTFRLWHNRILTHSDLGPFGHKQDSDTFIPPQAIHATTLALVFTLRLFCWAPGKSSLFHIHHSRQQCFWAQVYQERNWCSHHTDFPPFLVLFLCFLSIFFSSSPSVRAPPLLLNPIRTNHTISSTCYFCRRRTKRKGLRLWHQNLGETR